MSPTRAPHLSKTRFGAGLQCLKRLYLESYSRDLMDPITVSLQAIFDAGTAVGELARERYPGGHLIAESYDNHQGAAINTRNALADPTIPAIYEAAFTFERIRVRIDVLIRNDGDGFDLVEVKSTTGVKHQHIPDAAIQLYVAEGSGLKIQKVSLLHIDSSYVYEGGPYDLAQLFHAEDITDQARSFLSSTFPGALSGMWTVLTKSEVPAIDIGPHCTAPYHCSLYKHCHQGQPEHDIEQLPRARQTLLSDLKKIGIQDIRDIPSDFPDLSAPQQRVRDSVVSGRPYVGAGLASALGEVAYPVHFLDFETFNPALPVYPGTRPYQAIPFQWSLHVQDSQGNLHHDSFLHTGTGDPRDAFSATLTEAIGPVGTIVVYSNFEQTRVKELAAACPRYSDQLLSLGDRFFDLLNVVREHYYHPGFHGSYSMKNVLPALVPELDYEDLGIQDGSTASAAFTRIIDPATDDAERVRIRGELVDYCQRDTEGMVRIFEVLSSA